MTRRRQVLECMLWAGTGVLWTVVGGVPRARLVGDARAAESGLTFAQISDSHIGFARDPNIDTPGTLAEGVAQVKAAPVRPALMLHTGDVSHLSKAAEFDTAEQIISASGIETHYVPGEHDVIEDGARPFVARFQKGVEQGAPDGGFYSFDQGGVHFIGLNNVTDLKAGGLGNLGEAQLAWLAADLKDRTASTPIVLFAHIPLWLVYEKWGWGTADGGRVLELLKRFGSVTVLNGHIHQIIQKVEGHVAFHTARATAFPQPAPGTAPGPGPKLTPAGELRKYLGVAEVVYAPKAAPLAITDEALS